jgi:hypothetical protein
VLLPQFAYHSYAPHNGTLCHVHEFELLLQWCSSDVPEHTTLNNLVLVYAGSWAEDKMEGQGTYHYSSGDIYTGGFRQGKKHGSGMYNFKAHACQFLGIWSDGEFVEGKWVRSQQHHHHHTTQASYSANGIGSMPRRSGRNGTSLAVTAS